MIYPTEARLPLLQVQHVRVQFGPLAAVDDVSFILAGGDLLGLIGPNGAGKTTLLRAIAGLQQTTAGGAFVLGERVEPSASVLRQLGFTPDTPAFYDDLTVRQFLTFIAIAYGIVGPEAADRIQFWLEKVWLVEKADQKIRGLSRGMKQRIGIARTLLPNPAVVLLDEPAAGLDPAGRAQFRQLLVDLRKQGKALIVSSHILSDLSEYCTHVGIMSAGAMVQFGTVREISERTHDGRCRYAVELVRPMTALRDILQNRDGISGLEIDGERVVFEFAQDRVAAAALLAELVGRQMPVASFSQVSPGLEEAYLRTGIGQVD